MTLISRDPGSHLQPLKRYWVSRFHHEEQVGIRTLDFQEMSMLALAMVTLQRRRDRENTSGRPRSNWPRGTCRNKCRFRQYDP